MGQHLSLLKGTVLQDLRWIPERISLSDRVWYCKDARRDQASLTYVYSLRGRTRLIHRGTRAGLYTQHVMSTTRVGISRPGEDLADLVESTRGFPGPPSN